jgi:hypothetical protein
MSEFSKFSDWVQSKMDAKDWSQEFLAEQAGVARITIQKGLAEIYWSERTAVAVSEVLGALFESGEAIRAAGYDVDFRPGRERNAEPKSGLIAAMRMLERTKPKFKDREEALRVVLATVRKDRKAFLAAITPQIPTPFKKLDDFHALRDALYGAHDEGLMTLFIVPTEDKLRRMRDMFGPSTVPESEEVLAGYSRYRDGYIARLADKGLDASITDMRMHLIQVDTLDAAGWLYIVCLIGEVVGYHSSFTRVFERGPACNGIVTALPRDSGHEDGLRQFIKYSLNNKYKNKDNEFSNEFIYRMGMA